MNWQLLINMNVVLIIKDNYNLTSLREYASLDVFVSVFMLLPQL